MKTFEEELEQIKVNCPTCALPHNLSSRDIKRISFIVFKGHESERFKIEAEKILNFHMQEYDCDLVEELIALHEYTLVQKSMKYTKEQVIQMIREQQEKDRG